MSKKSKNSSASTPPPPKPQASHYIPLTFYIVSGQFMQCLGSLNGAGLFASVSDGTLMTPTVNHSVYGPFGTFAQAAAALGASQAPAPAPTAESATPNLKAVPNK